MKDSFDGTKTIRLQVGSDTVPYTFTFAINSSATANDGSIPFGTTITTAAVKAFDEDGNDVTAEIVASQSEAAEVVSVGLTYPAVTGDGRYSLEFVLTLSSGAILEYDFTRVYAEEVTA